MRVREGLFSTDESQIVLRIPITHSWPGRMKIIFSHSQIYPRVSPPLAHSYGRGVGGEG